MDNKLNFPQVNQAVELVQVLIYLAEEQGRTYQKLENQLYADKITEWFEKYKCHRAVALTKNLICEKCFVHIRPLQAILKLDKIAADEREELYDWANAVIEFREASDYDKFFQSQESYYREIVAQIDSKMFFDCENYVEKMFRQTPTDFHLLISPIAGNYGFTIGDTAFAVLYDGLDYKEYQFARSFVHEYSHCFVNPVVEANTGLLEKCPEFFEQHTNMLSFYNVDYAVINEYMVRAVVIRFLRQNPNMYSTAYVEEEIARQEKNFPFIESFVSAIVQYEKSDVGFEEFYLSTIERVLREHSN